jgi:hypothetical protein
MTATGLPDGIDVTCRLDSARRVVASLRAGTNFSCWIPELEEILRDARIPAE